MFPERVAQESQRNCSHLGGFGGKRGLEKGRLPAKYLKCTSAFRDFIISDFVLPGYPIFYPLLNLSSFFY